MATAMPPAPSPPLESVAGADGVWLQDSSVNLMVINAVFTVDRIDRDTLLELWDRRVMQADGGRRYPRFKKRIVRERHRFYWQDDPIHIPTEAREVYDVTGAGDTVVATLGAALGARVPLPDAVRLANRAAGIVVGKIGTSTVTRAELLAAGRSG